MIATGERVDVDGVIDGDLIATARRVTVRGEVTGGIYVLTRELEVSGEVGGGIHAAAARIRLEGPVAGSVFAMADEFTLASAARAQGDVNLMSDSAVVDGQVGPRLQHGGPAAGPARPRGTGRPGPRPRRARAARRLGGRTRRDREPGGRAGDPARARRPGGRRGADPSPGAAPPSGPGALRATGAFYAFHLLGFAAAFLFGLVAYKLAPEVFRGSLATGSDLLFALAYGFAAVVVTPLGVLVAALTFVGIPLAVALLFVFLLSLYTAELAFAAWLGRLVVAPADESVFEFGKSLCAGLGIVTALALVPFLGPASQVLVTLLGLGLLTQRARFLWAPAS